MKRVSNIFSILLVLLIGFTTVSLTQVKAEDTSNTIVYFYSPGCLGCQSLIGGDFYVFGDQDGAYDKTDPDYNVEDDYIQKIKDYDPSIEIIYVNIDFVGEAYIIPPNATYDEEQGIPLLSDVQYAFNEKYQVPSEKRYTPLMFVGDTYYYDHEIIDAIDLALEGDGDFFDKVQMNLLEIDVTAGANYQSIQGFLGFLGVLGAGLLDGFNPCAIALLLMFISIVGFTENKRVLIAVSVTYILTMFLTYFLIGVGILSALESFAQDSGIALIVSWVIFILVLIFFVFNLYDYFVSRKQEYGKVKNQLPKWIQRMNKRIMKVFANAMNEEGKKGNLTGVILLTFALGVTLSLTEFLCTGQIYLGILDGVRYFKTFYGYFALFSYNVMFVLPMIIIAFIAVKNESIVGVSNWVREHLHVIKLFNALLFLGIAIYYAFRIFG